MAGRGAPRVALTGSLTKEPKIMKTTTRRRSKDRAADCAIICKTVCGNPGCGFGFELTVNRANIGLLGRRLACPICRRPGGILQRMRRLGDRTFSSRLQFGEYGSGGSSSASLEADDIAWLGGARSMRPRRGLLGNPTDAN
jgi:hypothetical protein